MKGLYNLRHFMPSWLHQSYRALLTNLTFSPLRTSSLGLGRIRERPMWLLGLYLLKLSNYAFKEFYDICCSEPFNIISACMHNHDIQIYLIK